LLPWGAFLLTLAGIGLRTALRGVIPARCGRLSNPVHGECHSAVTPRLKITPENAAP
jgi:hypothetical protein